MSTATPVIDLSRLAEAAPADTGAAVYVLAAPDRE